MKKLAILLIYLTMILSYSYAKDSIKLNNNLKSNIDLLAKHLKHFVNNTKDNDEEIKDLFKLYYQNYQKIIAFELHHNEEYFYSSYKDNDNMILLKETALPSKYHETPESYKKEIFNKKEEFIGTLIVYFKNEIKFTKKEILYLQNKKVLRVQNDSNLPPYNFNENGIEKGYSIDYLNLIANKLALEVEYIPGKWNDFLNMLENKELDLMINVLKSKKRERRFLFSKVPFVSSPLGMLTRIEHKDVHTFKELEGETMALVKGYHSYDRVKRDYPKINIYPTTNSLEMMKAVSESKADAAYGLKTVLEYNINKHLLTNLKTTKNTDDDAFGFYFAYNKENSILESIIYKAEKLITKKELSDLEQKWFRKTMETKKRSKSFLFTEKEKAYLNKKNTITMCIEPNSLPFEEVSPEGKFIGIIADFFNQISKNTGIKFELLARTSWSDSIQLVKNKRCDILPFATQTQERDKYLLFTKEYFKFSNVIATKNSELFIDSLNDLKAKKIGIIKDYAEIELIKSRYKNIDIVEVKNNKEGLEKVKSGEIYAFINSFPSIAYSLRKHQIKNIKISGKTSIDIIARIAIRNDEVILQNILNKAINSISDEQREQILSKWMTILKEEKFDTTLFIQIVASIFILFVLIIIFIISKSNRKLNLVNKELEKLSQTDKLTSIYNRAKLDSIMEEELRRKKRYKKPLSVILIDIDHFKMINDTYGHLQGDCILKEFAKRISLNIRETDFLGRWGGEEFLLILPHTKAKEAEILANHLKEIIVTNSFDDITVTSSFGVYECKDTNTNKCISYADKALYEAKNSNRNCVRVFYKD